MQEHQVGAGLHGAGIADFGPARFAVGFPPRSAHIDDVEIVLHRLVLGDGRRAHLQRLDGGPVRLRGRKAENIGKHDDPGGAWEHGCGSGGSHGASPGRRDQAGRSNNNRSILTQDGLSWLQENREGTFGETERRGAVAKGARLACTARSLMSQVSIGRVNTPSALPSTSITHEYTSRSMKTRAQELHIARRLILLILGIALVLIGSLAIARRSSPRWQR